jgi:glycosyltransferase involved in cell wall biosynthesis
MKILALWTDWGGDEYRRITKEYGGLGYYRIVKPFRTLQAKYPEYDVDIIGPEFGEWSVGKTLEELYTEIFSTYDLVYLKQVDNPIAASALLASAEYFGKKVIFDIDDNHLAVRKGTTAYEQYKPGQPERYFVAAGLSLASGMVVSTQPLIDTYSPIQKSIDLFPNCNDVEDWKFEKKQFRDGKVRIGYMGSVTHNADFELASEPLKRVLQKYPNAELHLLGLMTKETFREFQKRFRSVRGRVVLHFGTPSWKGYPELLANMGFDIGIAPLIDDEFNRGKSHIKWMEYSMYKIPVVASDVYPYSEEISGVKTIQHGQTGYLAKTTEEWVKYLSLLIEKPELREDIGSKAYSYIKDHWQWNQHIEKFKAIIDKYAV